MTSPTCCDSDFDAMPGRSMAARWVLTTTLRLTTAAHFGGECDSSLDMPILRCGRTRLPLFPGTSMGGALRAYLLDRLAGYAKDEDSSKGRQNLEDIAGKSVANLFGGGRAEDNGSQSPLIIFDALGTIPKNAASTEVRDGVLIETATGVAANHKKFDFEVLPPGTEFELRFDLLIPTNADEGELLSLLSTSLEGLNNGDIRVGLRRSRGLGEVRCKNWTARRYALSTQEGWLQWIGSDHISKPDLSSQLSIREAIQSAMLLGGALQEGPDNRQRIVIEAEATILGDLLIRSPNTQADGPDVMHLTSGGEPTLSGTSLTGVMRGQALRIAQLVHKQSRAEAEDRWVAPLFGPRNEGIRNPDSQQRGSRLRVSEQPITSGQSQRITRVAIDRFTQGVVPTALFDEQTLSGGKVLLRFEIRNPRDGEVGLLLLVLKDLLTGQLPVGGSSSVGRGVLLGHRMAITGSGIQQPIVENFEAVETRQGKMPASTALNDFVQEFVRTRPTASELERETS